MLGEPPFVDDMKVDGHALRRLPLLAATPGPDVTRHRHERGRPVSPASYASSPPPMCLGERFSGLIDRGLAALRRRGRDQHRIGDILAAVVADTDRHARDALAAHPRRVRGRSPGVFSPEAARARARRASIPAATTSFRRSSIAGGCRRGAGSVAVCRDADLHDAADRARVPPEPEWRAVADAPTGLGLPRPEVSSERQRRKAGSTSAHSPVYPTVRSQPVKIEVFSQGQGIFDDRRQIASALGRPRSPGPRDAGLARRRLRRQGRPQHPGSGGS